jgi:hypothetical protein
LVERRDKFQCARALSLSEATGRILGAAVDVQLHFYELERRRNLRSVADGSSSKGLTSGQMREKESRRRFLPATKIGGGGGGRRGQQAGHLENGHHRLAGCVCMRRGCVRGRRTKVKRPQSPASFSGPFLLWV